VGSGNDGAASLAARISPTLGGGTTGRHDPLLVMRRSHASTYSLLTHQVGTYDYAGCMGVPRLLYLDPDTERLWQLPVPEISRLRAGEAWHASELQLSPDAPLPLPSVAGAHLDLALTVRRGSGRAVGVLLQAWDSANGGGAAVVFHWESSLLEVVFEALDPATMRYSLTAPGARHVGGPLDLRPGAPLELRLLLDGSVLEVFTGTGQVLATRVYRGSPWAAAGAAGGGAANASGTGIEFFSLDGDATLARVEAYEMASIWGAQEAAQRAAAEAALAAADAATAPAAAAAAAAAAGMPAGLALDLAAAIEKAQSAVASRAVSRVGSLAASLGGAGGGLALVAERLAGMGLASGGGGPTGASGPLSPPRVIAGGGDAWANEADGGLPPEEAMCADIFMLEA
jgi:hypothetical protein